MAKVELLGTAKVAAVSSLNVVTNAATAASIVSEVAIDLAMVAKSHSSLYRMETIVENSAKSEALQKQLTKLGLDAFGNKLNP